MRAKKIGRVVVNSAVDRPWSQYFCCMLMGNREFVRKNPVATKRAMRAILKSAEICAVAPEKVAKSIVAKGVAKNYDYALEAIKSLPYGTLARVRSPKTPSGSGRSVCTRPA